MKKKGVSIILLSIIVILVGTVAFVAHVNAVKSETAASQARVSDKAAASSRKQAKVVRANSVKQAASSSSAAASSSAVAASSHAKATDEANDNVIYLTFDDGPNDSTTPQLLKTLKQAGVHATFFVTGYGSDKLIKQEADDGHQIGLHTFTHDYAKVYASPTAYFNDLQQISDRVYRITGERSTMVRVPGGSANQVSHGIMPQILPQLLQRGYQYFDWNVSAGDGAYQSNADQPYRCVTTTLMPHARNVVLMHDSKIYSVNAVQRIIDFAKAHGYRFATLNMQSWPSHQR